MNPQDKRWQIHRHLAQDILFYDHDQGEYSDITQFVSLNIEFFDFLQMAFLYQDLECLLEKEDNIDKIPINTFITAINSIYPNLYELYPFRYLEWSMQFIYWGGFCDDLRGICSKTTGSVAGKNNVPCW